MKAPTEQKWPKMDDKFYEALGWMHAECCAALDAGEDPRGFEVGDMIERCIRDLTRDDTAKPQSSEWDGEGLPPVGVECEAIHFNSWAHVEIVAHVRAIDGPKAVFQLVGFNEWNAYSDPSKFRPLRTQAEREREELVKLMEAERESYFPKAVTAEDIADAILAKYELKERTNDNK